jgi:hypothetical protein
MISGKTADNKEIARDCLRQAEELRNQVAGLRETINLFERKWFGWTLWNRRDLDTDAILRAQISEWESEANAYESQAKAWEIEAKRYLSLGR